MAAALPGLPLVVVNLRQTRDFARAGGPGLTRPGAGAGGRPTGRSRPARPQRLAAQQPQHQPRLRPTRGIQFKYMSYSLHQRTTRRLPTPITRLPHDTQGRRAIRPSGRAQCGDERPGREGRHLAGAPHLARPAADRPPRTEPGAAGHPARGSHPALPQRLAAEPPGSAPPPHHPASPPRSHCDYLSYSLNQRIKRGSTHPSPATRRPQPPNRLRGRASRRTSWT